MRQRSSSILIRSHARTPHDPDLKVGPETRSPPGSLVLGRPHVGAFNLASYRVFCTRR